MLLLLSAGGVFYAAQAFIFPNILYPASLPADSGPACAQTPNIQLPLSAKKKGLVL